MVEPTCSQSMYMTVGQQLCSSKHQFAMVSRLLHISAVSHLKQRVAVGAIIATRAGATLHSEHEHESMKAIRHGWASSMSQIEINLPIMNCCTLMRVSHAKPVTGLIEP
jgi:hypothetical protein